MKIIKSLMIMYVMFMGVQLYCTPFTAQVLRPRGSGKISGPETYTIDLDSSDTGAQAKQKIEQQAKISTNNKRLEVIINESLSYIWPDDKSGNKLESEDIISPMASPRLNLITNEEALARGLISEKGKMRTIIWGKKDTKKVQYPMYGIGPVTTQPCD